jgi:CDP-glycerol:poly(glycerophosphate) glycerophosphotransferase
MALPITVSNFLRSPNRGTAAAMANAVRNRQRRARRLSRTPRLNREPEQVMPPSEVIVYFAEDRRRLYQLDQWLPVLSKLHEVHRVTLVLRKLESFNDVRERTTLPIVYVRRLADVLALYDELDPKVAIYVNNGVANFQSLAVSTILHVHVNHGESDKVSMVSNQAKAYDRVFVAGEAAERRHAAALINFDQSRLVRTGRPQLDLEFDPVLPATDRRTVLYAPTWEGENDFNNYSSIDVYGVQIVRQLLALDRIRVIYRPHPRVASSTTPEVLSAHQQVEHLLTSAAHADPSAGHGTEMDGSILSLFQHCDAMVTDVSSVGLDFLYLQTEKPVFLTDRRNDPMQLATDAPISAASDVIDADSIDSFGSIVAARLESDALLPRRQELRRFYFGDLGPGESTERFLAAVGDVVAQRDELLAKLPPHEVHAAGAAAATGDMGAEEDEARFVAENALGAADEALSAAEDALAAAKDTVTTAREPAPGPQSPHAYESDEAAVAAAPMATPTSGGIQIR